MKKVLLSLTAGMLSVTMASAQCTPLASYADSTFGLWPDSADFLMVGPAAGLAFNTQIDIKTFVDTFFLAPAPVNGVTATIDKFKILSITGQPEGFNWFPAGPTWNEADSTWTNPGTAPNLSPTQGCITISADATSVLAADLPAAAASGFTDYPLVVTVDARIAATNPNVSFIIPNGTWLTAPIALLPGALEIKSYVLRVYHQYPTGVAQMLNTSRFELGQNYPNPAADESVISFTTPSVSNVEFRVYNMLGMLVKSQDILSEKGLNQVKVNTRDFSAGMYVYTMTNGGTTLTKKMTVK